MSKAKEPKPHRDSDGVSWCREKCPAFIDTEDTCELDSLGGCIYPHEHKYVCQPAVSAMAKRLVAADAVIERLPKWSRYIVEYGRAIWKSGFNAEHQEDIRHCDALAILDGIKDEMESAAQAGKDGGK